MTENHNIVYYEILENLRRCKAEDETETRILLLKALGILQFDLKLISKKVAEMTEAIDLTWR